ncbi:hypothetical protein OHA84_37165 [Streptomyces sp. NBC_00513]|uniref:hypothetical protein n=1 Tax=unclassified Streptomyces TaxID=2593676 RepID=UPI00224D8BCB|nr:hypothetical protein [Streptomyces sp. NBC_00424]MCX5078601.1 hypothetical protein [Streptomyces sp. NBC_00424]WUD39047.1 hypothetical protein OHA84_00135 [Streptomyces sp. NBC_00513]WUD45682.1 hypothetical protein OHA84_37165 [Streptomyces sp. NBC_00513]
MDHYAGRRRGCRNLTDVQDELARRLEAQAGRLRAEAGRGGGDGLSVVEAVALAAVQLGLKRRRRPREPAATGGAPRRCQCQGHPGGRGRADRSAADREPMPACGLRSIR